jgi:phage-related minor tail protein
VPTAVKALARAFADPEKGAQQLEDALGKLSSKQIQTVQDLAKAGDHVGAQRALSTRCKAPSRGWPTTP